MALKNITKPPVSSRHPCGSWSWWSWWSDGGDWRCWLFDPPLPGWQADAGIMVANTRERIGTQIQPDQRALARRPLPEHIRQLRQVRSTWLAYACGLAPRAVGGQPA